MRFGKITPLFEVFLWNMHRLKGAIVALITPMKMVSNEVDYEALEALVDFHIKNNTRAIAAVGTTGESATLSKAEHFQVLKEVVRFANGRIPVIAGTGANATAEAIELTAYAKKVGADACLLVTPYYNKPTQEGLYQHYKMIAETVDIPQILYDVPGRTAVNLKVETTLKLTQINNIIGLKDATGDLTIARALIARCPEDFLLYSGDDMTALDFILLGGDGGISVSANVVPDKISALYDFALAGKQLMAKKINQTLENLHKHLFTQSNPIPVKWALYKMGRCSMAIRLPLTVLSAQYQDIIHKDLLQLGLPQNEL